MVFQFQGSLDNVQEVHKQFISDVLRKHGFKDEVVDIEPVGKPGDNYAADVKRIIVKADGKPFQIVAKFATQDEVGRISNQSAMFFKNEHIMYTEVLPKLVDLQITAGIPKEERFKYPVCYGNYMEEPYEMILLEDLQLSNYVMLDKFESLTDATVRLILKDFALFHSLSYVWKAKEPETFKQTKNKLRGLWSTMSIANPEAMMYFTQLQKEIMSVLKSDKYKKVVDGLIDQLGTIANKLSKIDVDGKYSVIQQGDAWTNNFMFRVENGIPVENIMIDYQISNEFNPVGDLLYMTFNCTDYKTRSKHYLDWIDYYHSELDKSLNEYGLKANMVYPRDQLDADLRRYSKYNLILAIVTSSILLRKTEDAAAFKEAMANNGLEADVIAESFSMIKLDDETIAKFKARVEGLIDSMYDYGYL